MIHGFHTNSIVFRKLKVNDIKNPTAYAGQGSMIMQMESQRTGINLNSKSYTGFLEFQQKNCGNAFIKAVANGLVDFQIFDSKGSAGLYSVLGAKGVFLKTTSGKSDLSGATVQFTKNFATLGEMLGDNSKLEMNQKVSKKGKVTPTRDTFMLSINGEAVDAEAGFKMLP